jgi:hypothetical protein
VVTGDALFCQRNLCQQVLAAGGDYLLIVKDNQPTLHADLLHLLFDPTRGTLPLTDRREAISWDNGHGRPRARRRLVASTDLTGYLDWPGLAQVWRWERRWQEQHPAKAEVRYGITSLPPHVFLPPTLNAYRRRSCRLRLSASWGILPWAERCQNRKGVSCRGKSGR